MRTLIRGPYSNRYKGSWLYIPMAGKKGGEGGGKAQTKA